MPKGGKSGKIQSNHPINLNDKIMPASKDIKILVVEDNEKIRTLLTTLLRNIGFENLYEAENGQVAFEKMQAFGFDLVLTDWMMPIMDGLELLKAVRADERLKATPMMMITASDSHESVIQAAQYRINGYIVKPFSVKTIVQKIDAVFDQA